MKKNIIKSIFITLAIVLLVLLPICTIFLSNVSLAGDVKTIETQEEVIDWYHVNKSGVTEKLSIPDNVNANVNEEYTIYGYLKEVKYNETLYLYTSHQTIKVFIEDEMIYTNSTIDNRLFGKAENNKIHLIDLPDDSAGKKISITFSCPYLVYSGAIFDLRIDTRQNIIDYIFQNNIIYLGISLILLCASVALFFSSFIFLKTYPEFTKVNNVLASSIFLSLFFILESKILTMITSINTANISYLCLIVFNMFVTLYMYKESKNRRRRFVPFVLFILNSLHLVSSCLLHIFGVFDLFETLAITIILENAHVIYLLISKIELVKKGKNKAHVKTDIFEAIMAGFILLANIVVTFFAFSNTGLFLIPGGIFMIYVFVRYSMSINEVVLEAKSKSEIEDQLKETKNYLINSQMKSHFVFNTLGAIRTMIVSHPKMAYEMTTDFTKYLRANISNTTSTDLIPFQQELEHIKAYLSIETKRFMNRLKIVYDIKTVDFYIPPLSVEPLVENAVKHGVCKKIKGGTVKISTSEDEEFIYVSVEDNGIGFDIETLDEASKKGSVGLRYIKTRLKQLANADFDIISSENVGTKAIIKVKK